MDNCGFKLSIHPFAKRLHRGNGDQWHASGDWSQRSGCSSWTASPGQRIPRRCHTNSDDGVGGRRLHRQFIRHLESPQFTVPTFIAMAGPAANVSSEAIRNLSDCTCNYYSSSRRRRIRHSPPRPRLLGSRWVVGVVRLDTIHLSIKPRVKSLAIAQRQLEYAIICSQNQNISR